MVRMDAEHGEEAVWFRWIEGGGVPGYCGGERLQEADRLMAQHGEEPGGVVGSRRGQGSDE